MFFKIAAFCLTIVGMSGQAFAQAGGPDEFVVSGVARSDALNLRKGPSANTPVVGQLQNGDRLRNLGCKQVRTANWCKVENDGTLGWVSNRYIREYTPTSVRPTRPPREPEQQLPLGDTAATSLDWNGTYSGIFPCPDCKGIKTNLTLKLNKTYVLHEVRIDKNRQTYRTTGRFSFDRKNPSIIQLDEEANFRSFFVGENFVEEVDFSRGKPVRLGKRHRMKKN